MAAVGVPRTLPHHQSTAGRDPLARIGPIFRIEAAQLSLLIWGPPLSVLARSRDVGMRFDIGDERAEIGAVEQREKAGDRVKIVFQPGRYCWFARSWSWSGWLRLFTPAGLVRGQRHGR